MTVQEVSRTMLNEAKFPDNYWREAIYTTVYIQNRGQLRVNNDKTTYELWFGRPTSVKYFRVFGSKCYYIKRDDDNLGKFDSRTNEGIFLGYSSTKKEYRCYNLRSHKIIEITNVIVNETKPRKNKVQENEDDAEKDEDSQKEEFLKKEKGEDSQKKESIK